MELVLHGTHFGKRSALSSWVVRVCLIPSRGLYRSISPADTLYVEGVHGEAKVARLEAYRALLLTVFV